MIEKRNKGSRRTLLAKSFLALVALVSITSQGADFPTAVLPSTRAGQLISDWMKVCAAPTVTQLRKWTAENLSPGNILQI